MNNFTLKFKHFLIFILIPLYFSLNYNTSDACTRIVSNKNGIASLVARNMDWFEGIKETGLVFYVLPRGQERNGLSGDANSLTWISKYGSIVISEYGGFIVDGMNEKGLSASILYLEETNFGERNIKIPGLATSLWLQYYIDSFETVEDAVKATNDNSFQLLMMEAGVRRTALSTIHLAITDISGDTAIFEYIDGKVNIYHNKKYTIMTNSPTYDKHLASLKTYQDNNFQNLPGTTSSNDRFIRAYYYSEQLPKASSYNEAIAGIVSITSNVAKPFSDNMDPDGVNISNTAWTSVMDQTNLRILFVSRVNPFMIWVDLKDFDLKKGASTKYFDYRKHLDALGNISKKFTKIEKMPVIGFVSQK